MIKGTRWKHQEDLAVLEIVLDYISKGINFREAFPIISKKIGRTEDAVSARWYSSLMPIYGEAIKQAEQKQPENAMKIVSSILNNQGPLEVTFESSSSMGLVIPSIKETDESFNFTPPSYLDDNPINLQSVISFMTSLHNKVSALEKENSELYDELEKALEDAERLKVELIDMKDNGPVVDEDIEKIKREHNLMLTLIEKCRKMADTNV